MTATAGLKCIYVHIILTEKGKNFNEICTCMFSYMRNPMSYLALRFSSVIAAECFTHSHEECPSAQNVNATDMAFILSGSSHKPMPSWKLYIQKASTVNRKKTTVASRYLPIIQDPAFELDTLNTVAKRVLPCSQIDGTAACRSDGGRGTLSKAAETEVVDRRVKGHTYTLPWRTSHCHALSGCNRTTHE